MGPAMGLTVVEVADSAILKVATTPVTTASARGSIAGSGSGGIAVAHTGSNNMITFRYRLKQVPMKIAEKAFTADKVEFPAWSFVITDASQAASARASAGELGPTGAALSEPPSVPMHESELPRIAIYSQWTGTQNLGWYRLTFDEFEVPYDLIYKEQLVEGNLRSKYDVILTAEQNLSKRTVMAKPKDRKSVV